MRIDRWLFHVRFYKTRSLAAKAVSAGHVSINGSKSRPSSTVKVGDEIGLRRQQLDYTLQVAGLPPRRGSAAIARTQYTEDPESAARREQKMLELRLDRKMLPQTKGRPDKRTRRQLLARSRQADD